MVDSVTAAALTSNERFLMKDFRTITHEEARGLLAAGALALDVRTPGEYEGLGHIPGAWLMPVDLVASAPAVLPDDGRPIVVYCEHGVRSVAASRLLCAAGIDNILNLSGGLAVWSGPRDFGGGVLKGPSSWLIENADLLPRGGRVLDVACGRGRHALLLASAGFSVEAIDRDPEKIAFLKTTAERLSLRLEAEVVDLETDPPPDLGSSAFDAVIVFNYLHRALMPRLRESVKPGGRIFYETFTRAQAERGHPRNPDFLLAAGELEMLLQPWTTLRRREGEFDDRFVASIVAERPRYSQGLIAVTRSGSRRQVTRGPAATHNDP
jgi:rhodanese-related sulfurtransferase